MSQLNVVVTADPEVLDALRGLTQALKRFNSTVTTNVVNEVAPAAPTPPIPTVAAPAAPAPVAAPAPEPATPAPIEPTPALAADAVELTAADLKAVATAALRELINTKGRQVGVTLLQEFGAPSFSGIKPEQYADFIAKARAALA